MHELHLVNDMIKDLLKAVEKENVKKVTKLYISMGGLTEITPDTLKFHFTEKAKGTPAEGAVLEISNSKVREIRLKSFDCE